MEQWLISLSTEHLYWVYAFILLTAVIEGPILSVLFGILIKLGYFSFWPIYTCLMLGDIMMDSVLYYLGHRWGYTVVDKFGKYVSLKRSSLEKATRIFGKYKKRILIISKLTNGFGLSLAVLVTAGITRIPFGQYISLNIVGQFIWTGVLMATGYYFSHLYLQIDGILGKLSVIGLFLFVVLVFLGFIKYIRNRENI